MPLTHHLKRTRNLCGLVGVLGHITYKEENAFNQLLLVDTLRGKHSTGVALVSAGGDVDVFKKAVNALDFLDFNTYGDLCKYKYNCMLGHNRYATKGAINNVNAHPFEFDNVVGMHNGTLKNYVKLDNSVDFNVDSECLYSHINDNGVQDAVNKMTGAYALTWIDKENNKLHFLRNNERPLSYCYTVDGSTMFWASEAWMLTSVLGRNGIKHKDVVNVTPDVLYTFDVPVQYATANVKLTSPKVCKTVKPPVVKKQWQKSNVATLPHVKKSLDGKPSFTSYVNKVVEFCVNDSVKDNYNAHYIEGFIFKDTAKDIRIYTPQFGDLAKDLINNRDLGNFKGTVRRHTKFNNDEYLILDLRTISFLGEAANLNKAEEVEDFPTYDGFQGEELDKEEFEYATRQGCVWCGNPVDINGLVTFVQTDEFICEHCHTQPEVAEWVLDSFRGI